MLPGSHGITHRVLSPAHCGRPVEVGTCKAGTVASLPLWALPLNPQVLRLGSVGSSGVPEPRSTWLGDTPGVRGFPVSLPSKPPFSEA